MKSRIRSRSFCVAMCCVAGMLTGCEEPLEFGQVHGTVSLDGQPLNEVLVMFLPEPEAGKRGAHSECVSDDQGKYELVYSQDAQIKGALVGEHRVVVEDIAAENSRDQFLPVRIHQSYSSAAHTPLRFEVKPGDQTIDLELHSKK